MFVRKSFWWALKFICCITTLFVVQSILAKEVSIPKYVEMIYLRIKAVGQALIEFEQMIIDRLEKKRPIDTERAVARFISARQQIRKLYSMASSLEKRISDTDPRIVVIQRLKGELRQLARAHRENMEKIKSFGIKETIQKAASALQETLDEMPILLATHTFPIYNLNRMF